MSLVTLGFIILAVWIGALVVIVLAVSKASGRADADEERYLAQGHLDVSNRLPVAPSDTAVGGERRPLDAGELERQAERLGIQLPERPRLHLPRLVWTRRHR